MDTEEVSDRFMAPCFANGLEAYDGEINLGVEENMISNEYAIKLCLEHEVKRGNKVVKKELIVALRGEIYFVKFIINPEEDDVEPEVILGRTFVRMTKQITDFRTGTVIIYPDIDPFLEDIEEEEKSLDDWDHLLDFNLDDVPLLGGEELQPFVCKMGKSSRNKKRSMENLSLFYQDIGTSSSAGGHLTQEEAVKEALAIRISQKFALLEEVREEMKKVDRGITMINHTQAEAMGILTNVLCQVRVTTLIAKFLIPDIPIDRDAPIVVGRGFLRMIGGIVNTPKRLFSTFDGFCHQTFRAARSDVMRNTESGSDDEEEYEIKRNKFEAPIYGLKPAPYLNCNDPTMGTHDDEAGSSRSKRPRQHETVEEVLLPQVHHEFLLWEGCNRDGVLNRMGCDGEINDMLRIRLHEDNLNEEIFTSVAWIRAFNINKLIYAELCYEFYSTYEFDKVCADDELQIKNIIKFRLGGRAHNLTFLEFARRLGLYHADELEKDGFNVYFEGGLRSDEHFNAQEYWLSISREENLGLSRLDTTPLRDLIDSQGTLIPEDLQLGVPRVGIPRPPRAFMQDLYDRMSRMEIRQEGAYNLPGYAQPQYDQYYQQYPPPLL
ncbi:hypothetical protein Tco_1210143 [Tanacetum coccineum]